MSLNYEFVPIDVSITTHPKAFKAGIEAMGLWLWGMAHAKQHRTGGIVHRDTVVGAWGSKRTAEYAKRLVQSGLWIEREDGDWEIHNFEKKGPGSPSTAKPTSSSADRMRRLRDRRAKGDATSDGPCDDLGDGLSDDLCDASPDPSRDVTSVTSASSSVSNSSSLSLSSSDQPDRSEGPPGWWEGAVGAASMVVGDVSDSLARWASYRPSRARKRWSMNHEDAVGWLCDVVRGERDRRVRDGRQPTGGAGEPSAPARKPRTLSEFK